MTVVNLRSSAFQRYLTEGMDYFKTKLGIRRWYYCRKSFGMARWEMLKELEDYDWEEVFGEGSGGNCTAIVPSKPPMDSTSVETFSREDVAEIRGLVEGEKDESSWIVWGRLKDGRFFFAEGSCDYTGWDCRASNSGSVASTENDLVRFCITPADRDRFGITLSEL